MDFDMLLLIGIGLAIVIIVSFLVRSLLKIIIICGVIYFLFHIGFIWNADDLNEKLSFTRYFNPEVQKKIESVYGDFAEKRNQHEVVNVDEVKKVIDDTIQSAIIKAENKMSKIDKEELLKELEEKLKGIDTSTAKQAIDKAQEKLHEANLSTEEVQSVITK